MVDSTQTETQGPFETLDTERVIQELKGCLEREADFLWRYVRAKGITAHPVDIVQFENILRDRLVDTLNETFGLSE